MGGERKQLGAYRAGESALLLQCEVSDHRLELSLSWKTARDRRLRRQDVEWTACWLLPCECENRFNSLLLCVPMCFSPLRFFVQERWALYGSMAIDAIVAAGDRKHQWPNMTAWAIAEDNLTDSWAHDTATMFPTSPSGDAVALSQAAYTKYSALLLKPLSPPPPPVPPSNSTPAGYESHTGGYWKSGGMTHGAGHTVATCAATCTVAKAACVAFELSATRVCYVFASTSGGFIRNQACRTFTKKKKVQQRHLTADDNLTVDYGSNVSLHS